MSPSSLTKSILPLAAILLLTTGCGGARRNVTPDPWIERSEAVLDSVYTHFSAPGTPLMRENYPFDDRYTATYLAEPEPGAPNPYAYLWPFSGTLSAAAARYEATADPQVKTLIDTRILPGLEEYFDTTRHPAAYASYINSAPPSDRFYDDNVWLGIDFTDLYLATGEQRYLDKARTIWEFIRSGTDSLLGGGIYWCEQQKLSKNTCSNAPGAVLAAKLYRATQEREYLDESRELYHWTRTRLRDSTDGLYFDNVALDGHIGQAKFAYNSGQMMQAAVLLYRITGEETYIDDARELARACHGFFFEEFQPREGESFRIIRSGNVWFSAVMVRGYMELYRLDGNPLYIDDIRRSLDYAWEHGRDAAGLFSQDWKGELQQNDTKWLLTQAAMSEMYARVATPVALHTVQGR